MMRLRVSTLESWRYLLLGVGTEADLLERMRNQWADKDIGWKPRAGTAFHACLEDPIGTSEIAFDEAGMPFKRHRSGDYCFAPEAVESVRRIQGPGLREVKAVKVMCGVEIEGTCDHLRGLMLRDTKTKFDTIDVKHYEGSLQWRFYLWLHDCQAFTYDLCGFKEPGDGTDEPRGFCEFREHVSGRFWRYPGMEGELESVVRDMLAWHEDRTGRRAA